MTVRTRCCECLLKSLSSVSQFQVLCWQDVQAACEEAEGLLPQREGGPLPRPAPRGTFHRDSLTGLAFS